MYVVSRDENEVDNQGENFSCNKLYVLTFYFVQIHSKKVLAQHMIRTSREFPLVDDFSPSGWTFSGGNLRQTVWDGGLSVTEGTCLLSVTFDLLTAKGVSIIRRRWALRWRLTLVSKHSLSGGEGVVLVALGGSGWFGWALIGHNNAIPGSSSSESQAFGVRGALAVAHTGVEVLLPHTEARNLGVKAKQVIKGSTHEMPTTLFWWITFSPGSNALWFIFIASPWWVAVIVFHVFRPCMRNRHHRGPKDYTHEGLHFERKKTFIV